MMVPTVTAQQLRSRDSASAAVVGSAISQAYGRGGPGVLLVGKLRTGFVEERARLLEAGRVLGNLSGEELMKLEFPDVDYSVGWSRGRERFKGVVDSKKGSFYANPIFDTPSFGDESLLAKYPYVAMAELFFFSPCCQICLLLQMYRLCLRCADRHYMHDNCWPRGEECEGLEECFKSIGSYINAVGMDVAFHCDQHVRSVLGADAEACSIEQTLRDSRSAKGRLLHYFPDMDNVSSDGNESVGDSRLWCGYHNDHSTLTGLVAGEYFHADSGASLGMAPDAASGLYVVRSGSSEPEKVSIPRDWLAFQIGESAQIVSGGVLRATPHGVKMPAQIPNACRVTLAVFLQPNPWDALDLPKNTRQTSAYLDNALESSPLVPSLRSGRYAPPNDRFSDFASKTITEYVN